MKRIITISWLALGLAVALMAVLGSPVRAETCKPTEPDALGPFYKPDAPVRSSVDKGYVLSGAVKSSADCAPVKDARIEFWLAGPNKKYDDEHRAVLTSDGSGVYRFESNFPPGYSGRPPHIHIRVSAKGFRTLVTQHYPVEGRTEGIFNLVLVPE
jgi:protocatechuate 3,4-dioxygenase beta subunit